jgi:hypothetical protein
VAPLGLWLLAIAVSDVVYGLAWKRSQFRGLASSLPVAAAVSVAGGFAVGFQIPSVGVLGLWTLVSAALWQGLREPDGVSPRRSVQALFAAGVLAVVTVVSLGYWPDPAGGFVDRLLRLTPIPGLARVTAARAVLLVGIVGGLIETANVAVRLALMATGVSFPKSRLRGGRIIGPLERLLIFGFALSGEVTGAALIASAKTLLRFPEVSRSAGAEGAGAPPAPAVGPSNPSVEELTEYFLVGSLVSWFLALLPVILLSQ